MIKYIKILKSFLTGEMVVDQNMLGLGRDRKIAVPKFTNYIRVSTLELVAQEIAERKVPGSVAELGVYQGQFAKYINKLFPDRTFYLFDTFEGFDEKDIKVDVNQQFSKGTQDFSGTSVQSVLDKMEYKDKCIIKKGWFPESLGGLEDTFCFVSLDADLYKPIYDGLEYFYPRLNKGGYIFIHDYNNKGYEGAKAAVREFCEKYSLSYIPISDTWGSVAISK
jgi:O-methyltransferase